ncbi:MAG: hypothetical protein QM708_13850 [Propioniciclava sp.]|uniref:hypothetical protein n=1 Tax=Propioniciclava sp. TaxID=2038686 RepID=UPI0039E2B74E
MAPWTKHADGVLASKPTLGSMGTNHEHVFVRGTDGNVYQKYWQHTVEPVGEQSFGVSECVYGWTAAYRQAGSQVTVRIQLNPDNGISAAMLATLRNTWRNGIISTWSNRFECRAPNGGKQPITFDVQWVTSNPHHVVRVQQGLARSNMTTWDTSDTGNVAAHEFGHMLGHPDEYADSTCPGRNPVSTGTVMDDNTETVARLYNRICGFHRSGHTPVGAAPEPGENTTEVTTVQLIDNLKPDIRLNVLTRLRSIAEGDPEVTDAEGAQVTFEVVGGAPGERYDYVLSVRGDGSAERTVVDELATATDAGAPAPQSTSGSVGEDVAARVFAAARDAGLFDDEAPTLPRESSAIPPDSLVAIVTVRDGDSVRRLVMPADDPSVSGGPLGDDVVDVPLSTAMRLPSESFGVIESLLGALREAESAL